MTEKICVLDCCHHVKLKHNEIKLLRNSLIEMAPNVLLLCIFLFISPAFSQVCSTAGFDSGIEVRAPLDIITFDNLGIANVWASASLESFRITPASSMEVTIFGVNDGQLVVLIINKWITVLGADEFTSWNKQDFYVSFQSNLNTALITFAAPIRQFSLKISHNQNCGGGQPQFTLKDSAGSTVTCMQFNVAPPTNSTNYYHVFRYRSATANVKSITLSGCQFVFDDLSYKVNPCAPSPCNTTTENCIDTGLDATCCPKNTTWNGIQCLSKRAIRVN